MPSFGDRSKQNLINVHPKLIAALEDAIQLIDFSVIQGYRSNEEQERLFKEGKTKARAGQSKHNLSPAQAIDFIPYPFKSWEDKARFSHVAGIIIGCGLKNGLLLRWGADWDRDGIINLGGGDVDPNESLSDGPHIEIVKEL